MQFPSLKISLLQICLWGGALYAMQPNGGLNDYYKAKLETITLGKINNGSFSDAVVSLGGNTFTVNATRDHDSTVVLERPLSVGSSITITSLSKSVDRENRVYRIDLTDSMIEVYKVYPLRVGSLRASEQLVAMISRTEDHEPEIASFDITIGYTGNLLLRCYPDPNYPLSYPLRKERAVVNIR